MVTSLELGSILDYSFVSLVMVVSIRLCVWKFLQSDTDFFLKKKRRTSILELSWLRKLSSLFQHSLENFCLNPKFCSTTILFVDTDGKFRFKIIFQQLSLKCLLIS